MSFFDDSSLAFLPSGAAGKDGKAYSIKPTDGTGDFTFSRGSNLAATRVGPTGLIEKGRENLLLQSNQFDTTWTLASQMLTPVGGQSGYDGTNDAWKIQRSDTSGRFIRQNISQSGVQTFSVYAKKGNVDYISLVSVGVNVTKSIFSLPTDGSGANTYLDSDNISAKISYISNGWYRVEAVYSDTITDVRIYPSETATAEAGVIADAFVYIQDAQVEIGLAATDYIESGATTGKAGLLEDEPRFDYSGGATCPSLLLEPSRTNVVPYTEYFEGLGGDAGLDFNYNDATSPEGLTNAVQVVSNNTAQSYFGYFNGTAPAGDNTFSVFAKYDNCQYICIRILGFTTGDDGYYWFDIQNGTKGSKSGSTITYDIEDYGNGWYRCYVIHNVDSGDVSGAGRVYLCDSDNNLNSALNKAAHLYGNQWEEGSYPTSYIPNHSGGSVTRGEENIEQATSSFDITGDYTFFFEVTRMEGYSSANSAFITLNNTTDSSIIFVYNRDNDKNIRFLIREGATGSSSIYSPVDSFEIGERVKFCIRKDSTKTEVFFNGSSIGSTTAHKPDGFNSFLSGFKLMTLHQNLVFPEALSDADCITLTT